MLPEYYEFFCPVKILCGRKALPNLTYELGVMGVGRPLVITDKGVVNAGLLDKVKDAFADSDLEIGEIFEDTPIDSSDIVCNDVAKIYREKGCDCIVAVGGGSVLDTAKGVNIVISERADDLLQFQGVERLTVPRLVPNVAIPTTAGTGSEVTAAAVIRNMGTGSKMAFMSGKLMPHVAIIDPALMMTMPPKITAATGMDALTHAIEAYTCLQKNPISDAYAAAAIKLIRDNLVKAVEDGNDADARLAMANAATLAGIAFSNSMVGMVHALAHATGGVAHVPHGVANNIYLPFALEYNLERIPESLAEVAELLGASPVGSTQEKAMMAAQKVRQLAGELNRICGLPLRLSDAGVKKEQLEKIAQEAINDGSLTYNPEDMTAKEALTVIKNAF